ncbi:hypothetical protein HY633_01455 [Candidatus Uhrbacteria bacterium]|nr:hypothetical protein [Candidatus Uhrbacteria bacterium]
MAPQPGAEAVMQKPARQAVAGPGIIERSRFAEEPLPGESTVLRRQLRAALKGPRLPAALKNRRTRHVNADPRVEAGRAAVVAAVANTYPDPIAALRSMENRLGAGAAEIARLANVNPARFGSWYGAARPEASHHHRPDRPALAAALAGLAEALHAAGREAARAWPTQEARRAERPTGKEQEARRSAQPSVGRDPGARSPLSQGQARGEGR